MPLPEGLRARRSADGVHDKVSAEAFGEALDGRHGVFVGSVDNVVGPELGGKFAAKWGRVDGDEGVRPRWSA